MQLLRPEALILLLLWAPFVWWYWRKQQTNQWQKVIEPALLNALSESKAQRLSKWRQGLLPLTLLLSIIALAGPAFNTTNQKTAAQGNLYIVLDNSLSMAAEDLSPDRITRAKRMILDWANSNLFNRVSIVTYSASAHLVTPLTNDSQTLAQQISSLSPFMMPEFGNRPELAFALVKQTIESTADTSANILWISDDIAPGKVAAIRQQIPAAVSLTFVAVGTQAGSPIPLPNNQGYLTNPQTNAMVLVKADLQQMRSDAQSLGFANVALGAEPVTNRFEGLSQQMAKLQGYQEIGYWLLIPMLLLWLFDQKRGSVIASFFLVILLMPAEKTYAASLFQNKEQQAYQALEDQDYDTVQQLTSDPMLAGQAAFQAENYEEAEQFFSQSATADALFNQANTLVYQQEFDQAIKLYDQLLAQQDHDGAKKNKELVEEFLKNNSQQNQNQNQQNENDSSSEQQQNEQQQSDSQDSQQNSEQQEAEQNAEQQEQQSQSEQQEGEENESEQQESEAQQSVEQRAEQTRSDQEVESILNQLDQPNGSVLQQKFRYQYQQNPTGTDETLW